MSNLGGGPRITVETTPAYELVLSLSVAAEGSPTEAGSALQRVAGPELIRRVRSVSTSSWMWAHLLSVVYEAPVPRDVPAFRAFLGRMPALELQRRLVGYYVRWFRRATPTAVMDLAIRGERAAVRTFLRTSYPEDERWQGALRARLEAGAAQGKRELVAVVDAWAEEVFPQAVAPTVRQLSAAAAAMRRAHRESAGALASTLGWDYVPEPGIARVLVIPSLVIRPHDHQFDHEQVKIICVPVEPPVGELAGSEGDLLSIARALADETRLRLVLTLREGPLPAQELAERTGAGLTTVLHHLALLREAGLVADGGRRRSYRLVRERVTLAGTLLTRSAAATRVDEGGRDVRT